MYLLGSHLVIEISQVLDTTAMALIYSHMEKDQKHITKQPQSHLQGKILGTNLFHYVIFFYTVTVIILFDIHY